ncbi:xylulokinase [Mycobacterium sp.]|uniref:xylulokinase n=1 Tax=Mycobacterium sp. TaxID=1785 RepID=UPI003A85A03C
MSRGDTTIGIDIGTTAVKATAVDENGQVRARVRIPHRLLVPAPDRLEHDADEAWRCGPLAAMRRLNRPDARAVAVSSMVPSLTAVDAGGRPVTPGLLYGDARGAAPDSPEQSVPAAGEAAGFLRWSAAEAPAAAGFWPAPAVANHALAGEPVIDLATAITTSPLFDGSGWDAKACADCGAAVAQLPRVEMFGAPAGQVQQSGSRGAVLATGAVDALCEQLVTGADGAGDVLLMCGTTLIVWTATSEPRRVPGLWTIPHTVEGLSLIGGASNAGGLFLNWVDRLVAPADPAAADPRRIPVWLPYIRGERTPLHDRQRRAMLYGADLTHNAASVRRAAYEASAFVARRILELGRTPVRRVIASGGGTRVRPWLQALADATGRPIEVSAAAEGAALGAAFLARMAVGLESKITDAARWARAGAVVEPDPRWVEPTGDRYHRFLELCGSE